MLHLPSAASALSSTPSQPLSDDPIINEYVELFRKREMSYMAALQTQNTRTDQLFQEKIAESYLLQQFAASNIKLSNAESSASSKGNSSKPKCRPPVLLSDLIRLLVGAGDLRMSSSDEDLEHASESLVTLVPIRLDIDVEGVKLRDTFTWNLQDVVVTPDLFSKILCEDLALSATFLPLISKSISKQLEDFFQHAPNSLLPFESDTRGNDGVELTVKDMPELRAVINLDITIDTQAMVDQFEWDIGCKRNNPEVFAEHLVNELGLIPEFKTAISHSIREQVQTLSKSLLLIDHKFDAPLLPTNTGGLIDDEDLATHFLPVITPRLVKRGVKEHGEFGPYLRVASAVDLERNEKELERDTRRKRRQTQRSRRLITLPDRESTRTNRTPVPRSFQFVSNPIVDASLVANAELRADANSVSVAATASGAGTGGSSTATSRFGAASGVTGTGVYNTRRRGQ
ncbi:hypothetical protein BSLG_008028 [Batrachochytrium salamandrivorans]|nr:hypothetical protein BSLG_008028 [Batrachochytrium salamandrivorans]